MGQQHTPTVLIIDDDEAMRRVFRRLLARGGYVVAEAVGGREAREWLREGTAADYVVTDLKMADGSGGWLLAG